jgi:hypothetical protein
MPQPSSSPGSAELEVVPVPHRLHGTPASYVSLKAGQPGMLVLALVLLLFALTAACLVIACGGAFANSAGAPRWPLSLPS